MPVEIINGYPCKLCGCWDIKVKENCIFNWVEVHIILREDTTDYICENFNEVLIRVIDHTEEGY